jgi:serine/threonine protein kinase
MEYHDEGRLFLKLKSQKGIATKDVLIYLQHIAQGIGHLHSKNIVYRNLKP